MHCNKCGNEVSNGDDFCVKCGASLASFESSASGDRSVNIAGKGSISNSKLHVGDIYEGEKPEEKACIDRTYVKPIILARNPVKSSWLVVSGLIGFIGSCASIFSVLGSMWQYLFILTIASSSFFFVGGITLRKTRFFRMFRFNLEANKEGHVFLTKVGGNCPKCDGILRLTDIEIAKDRYKTYVRCNRYDDHIWKFDPTVLD